MCVCLGLELSPIARRHWASVCERETTGGVLDRETTRVAQRDRHEQHRDPCCLSEGSRWVNSRKQRETNNAVPANTLCVLGRADLCERRQHHNTGFRAGHDALREKADPTPTSELKQQIADHCVSAAPRQRTQQHDLQKKQRGQFKNLRHANAQQCNTRHGGFRTMQVRRHATRSTPLHGTQQTRNGEPTHAKTESGWAVAAAPARRWPGRLAVTARGVATKEPRHWSWGGEEGSPSWLWGCALAIAAPPARGHLPQIGPCSGFLVS